MVANNQPNTVWLQSEDTDNDGVPDSFDGCPLDPEKSAPGICGCGVSDTDSDDDGIADCEDCIADVTNDGEVGGQDLAFVLAAWGDANLFPLADINKDGLVNGIDIGYLLALWGKCQ